MANTEKYLILPKSLRDKLINVPETGQGYHVVDVKLKNGTWYKGVIVLNGEQLKTHGEYELSEIEDVFVKNEP